jgi:hypothetical protein
MAYRRLGRFNKAAPTQVKTPYMIFSCHDDDNFPLAHIQPTCAYFNKPDDSFIQICAIDVGIRNCGIRIERRWEKANIVETVMLARIDFVKSEKVATNTIYYSNSIEILKNYLPHFEMCQYILIESQLPINYDAVRMSQHIITFLMANLANKGVKPMICEIDTYFKSRIFNAPKKMKKPELKKWCRDRALELLQKRGDTEAYNAMVAAGKQDDMGDVVMYCEGWALAMKDGIQPIKNPFK